jgi:hypothetical protein
MENCHSVTRPMEPNVDMSDEALFPVCIDPESPMLKLYQSLSGELLRCLGAFYSITTFIRDMRTLLQIRQFAQLSTTYSLQGLSSTHCFLLPAIQCPRLCMSSTSWADICQRLRSPISRSLSMCFGTSKGNSMSRV